MAIELLKTCHAPKFIYYYYVCTVVSKYSQICLQEGTYSDDNCKLLQFVNWKYLAVIEYMHSRLHCVLFIAWPSV